MRFARWQALLDSLDAPLVFWDLETTHMQPALAVPIEFGCAVYGPRSLLADDHEDDEQTTAARESALAPGLLFASSLRVNPGPDVLASGAFRRASKIHGITAADLANRPETLADLQDTAAGYLALGVPCGFNAVEYDDRVMWQHGPMWTLFEDRAQPTQIDVLRIVRAVLSINPHPQVDSADIPAGTYLPACFEFGTTEHHKETLSALSVCLLGIAHTGAHGALSDSLRSADILAALMELWPETCPGDLAGLQAFTRHPDGDKAPALRLWDGWDRMLKRESPADPWVFRGGKHRGCELGEVDRGYLQWMVSKGDFSPDTKALIRDHLNRRP